MKLNHQDFLMRQFQDIALVLAKIMGLEKVEAYEEVHELIDEKLRSWFEKNAVDFVGWEDADWRTFLEEKMPHEIGQNALAQLLIAKGNLLKKEGFINEGQKYLKKALFILEFVHTNSQLYDFERVRQLEVLKKEVREYDKK